MSMRLNTLWHALAVSGFCLFFLAPVSDLRISTSIVMLGVGMAGGFAIITLLWRKAKAGVFFLTWDRDRGRYVSFVITVGSILAGLLPLMLIAMTLEGIDGVVPAFCLAGFPFFWIWLLGVLLLETRYQNRFLVG